MARVKTCPSCQHDNRPDQPFCAGCGFSLADVEMSVVEHVPVAESTIEEASNECLSDGKTDRAISAEEIGRHPVLKFPWGDVEVADTLFVGRDPSISSLAEQIELEGLGWVSRRHAEIYLDEGKLYVRDVGSTNGTYVNGARIATQPVLLADGDQVSFSHRLVATVRLS